MRNAFPEAGCQRIKQSLAWLSFVCFAGLAIGLPQARSQRPGLIRDTDIAEGREETNVEKEKPYNPAMAEKIEKIGDFYLKKKNYAAAIERYLEALQYQPDRTEAFDALGRAYEKVGDTAKAAMVYKDFITKNPDSTKIPEFRAKLARLEKKS